MNRFLRNGVFAIALMLLVPAGISSGTAAAADAPAAFDPLATASALAAQAQECFKLDSKFEIERRECQANVRQAVAQLNEPQVRDVALAVERHGSSFGNVWIELVFPEPKAVKVSAFCFFQYVDERSVLYRSFNADVR